MDLDNLDAAQKEHDHCKVVEAGLMERFVKNIYDPLVIHIFFLVANNLINYPNASPCLNFLNQDTADKRLWTGANAWSSWSE
jgi:hypothetical protein